jgi:hypothetical protein
MASPGLRRVLSLFLIVLIASLFDVGALRAPIAQAQSSSPGEEVDVALVLAVDISYSMDPDELTLQRQGYVEALRSPQFHEALRKGLTGKIALTYMEWAGSNTQHVLIPWTVIDGAGGVKNRQYAHQPRLSHLDRQRDRQSGGAAGQQWREAVAKGHRYFWRRAKQSGTIRHNGT